VILLGVAKLQKMQGSPHESGTKSYNLVKLQLWPLPWGRSMAQATPIRDGGFRVPSSVLGWLLLAAGPCLLQVLRLVGW
jgi:hypothetical protein